MKHMVTRYDLQRKRIREVPRIIRLQKVTQITLYFYDWINSNTATVHGCVVLLFIISALPAGLPVEKRQLK